MDAITIELIDPQGKRREIVREDWHNLPVEGENRNIAVFH